MNESIFIQNEIGIKVYILVQHVQELAMLADYRVYSRISNVSLQAPCVITDVILSRWFRL